MSLRVLRAARGNITRGHADCAAVMWGDLLPRRLAVWVVNFANLAGCEVCSKCV